MKVRAYHVGLIISVMHTAMFLIIVTLFCDVITF